MKRRWIRWSFYAIKASANTCTTRSKRAKHARTRLPLATYSLAVSPSRWLSLNRRVFVRFVPSRRWTTVAGSASFITALRFAAAPRAPRSYAYMQTSRALLLRACTTVFQMYVHMLKTRTYVRTYVRTRRRRIFFTVVTRASNRCPPETSSLSILVTYVRTMQRNNERNLSFARLFEKLKSKKFSFLSVR